MIEVTLTPTFYDDHVERECNGGVIVKRTKSTVTVRLDAEAFDDLLSDAWYYGDASMTDGLEGQGMRRSALATFARLRKAWPERADEYIAKYGMP